MGSPDPARCNLYNKTDHGENPYHISNTYGGIPVNLLTNLIGLSLLIVAFLVLRRNALKVMTKIVKKDDLDKWTHLFFSAAVNTAQDVREKINRGTQRVVRRVGNGSGRDVPEGSPDTRSEDRISVVLQEEEDPALGRDSPQPEQQQQPHDFRGSGRRATRLERQFTLSVKEQTFWQWFKSIFTTTHEEIGLVNKRRGENGSL